MNRKAVLFAVVLTSALMFAAGLFANAEDEPQPRKTVLEPDQSLRKRAQVRYPPSGYVQIPVNASAMGFITRTTILTVHVYPYDEATPLIQNMEEPIETWTRLPGDAAKYADDKVFFMLNVELAPGQRPEQLIFRPFFETVDGEHLPTKATWHSTAQIPLERLDSQSQYVIASHSQIVDSRVRFIVERRKTLEKQAFTGGSSDLFAPDRQLTTVLENPFSLTVTIPRFSAARLMMESHTGNSGLRPASRRQLRPRGTGFRGQRTVTPDSSALAKYTPVRKNVLIEGTDTALPMDTKKVEIVLNSRLFERVSMKLKYTNVQIQTGSGKLPSRIELLDNGRMKFIVEPPESYMSRAAAEGIDWSLLLSYNAFDGDISLPEAVNEIYSMRVTGGDETAVDLVETGEGIFGKRQ
ncbi:MAG: hypothetical protein U5N86_13175 [Planctomycetota bacterium]|nr:hypothetical protein [Planctomycetota bacterium]